jgi:peptidoglycan/LPS O-acetylase OafA/YrhL
MQIALHIIKENFWFCICSGDIPAAYANYYKTHETGISSERQFLTHNEFLRLFAGFGCIGFLLIMFCFIYPPFLEKSWKSYYFVMIFTIILLSFLNEDTLDSQIGVTFAAYFYSLFLWGIRKEEQD